MFAAIRNRLANIRKQPKRPWTSFLRFDFEPSEWMFLIASLLTCVYQVIMAFSESWKQEIIRFVLVILCLLQAGIVVSKKILQKQGRRTIGVIIIANIIFMVWIICQDLAEQLELEEELIESYQKSGSFERLDDTTSTLVASGIFFANLEHFWGVIEACQHALSHFAKDSHHE